MSWRLHALYDPGQVHPAALRCPQHWTSRAARLVGQASVSTLSVTQPAQSLVKHFIGFTRISPPFNQEVVLKCHANVPAETRAANRLIQAVPCRAHLVPRLHHPLYRMVGSL